MTLSQRLYQDRYLDDADFEKVLQLFREYADCVDEVALMSETTMNAFFPMEAFEKTLPLLADRIARLRGIGVRSVGVNVLCTIGHHGEASRYTDDGRFQPLINWDGTAAKGCYCPNDPVFLAHIRRKYALVAQSKPDFVWVDDDVRIQMHDTALFPCFCPRCLQRFNAAHGTEFTRETLAAALNVPDGGQWRRRWVDHNSDTITRLCEAIEQATHQVDPAIELGFMHCNDGMSTYSGADYRRWLSALKCRKVRPGGGLYSDRMPLSYIEKAMECARSRDRYADMASDLQYEYEQFPNQRFLKSCHMAGLECLTVMANGFNGVAFDVLKLEPGGSLQDWTPFMDMIRGNRALWQAVVNETAGYHNEGVNPLLPPDYERCRSVDGQGWFVLPNMPQGYGRFAEIMHVSHTATLRSYSLNEIGIPMTAETGRQAVSILEGHATEALDAVSLEAIFSGGVLLDADALRCMERRGCAHLCGVRAGETYTNNIMERFTDDPVNGAYAGEIRDPRVSLMGETCAALVPIDSGNRLRVVCELIDMDRRAVGACCTLFENELGGRVAVLSASPFRLNLSSVKIHQLQELFDWLADGEMPLRMLKPGRIVPTIRVSEDRRHFLMLLVNGSMDDAFDVGVQVRLPVDGPLYTLDERGNRRELSDEARRTEDGMEISIRRLPRWGWRIICA